MQTIQAPVSKTFIPVAKSRTTLLEQFITWCNSQEKYRLGWLAAIITIHGCFLTPVTIFTVVISGNSFAPFITAIAAMVAALVANLAALPTRITIPVFILTVLIDLLIISVSVAHGFQNAGAYF